MKSFISSEQQELATEHELTRFGTFDATFCRNTSLDNLDEEKISRFLVLARRGRNFPLPFVLSKIDLWVGIRAESTQVPTKYEIPQEVVAEAIVNAVVHRDYTSNASVQVMLFKDRLEVWNPGTLPPTLTLEKLREPHASVPHNPLIAEPMYLTKYIERMGTGIRDMIRRCKNAGLPEPEIRLDGGCFVLTIRRKKSESGGQDEAQDGQQPESMEIRVLRQLVLNPKSKTQLSEAMGQKAISSQLNKVIRVLVADQTIEPTISDKPTSRLQKYQLTEKGHRLLEQLDKDGGRS